MSKIGYARVSSKDQNEGRQIELFKNNGVESHYIDKLSGKNTERPELQKMLTYVREGDILVVESISRFARNTRDLLDLVEQLNKKGVQFISIKENIDTLTPTGKFMLTIFGAVAELERGYILERQREGIDLARMEGRALGRPEIACNDLFRKNYALWKNGEISAVEGMKRSGLKKTTWYKMVKGMEM
jgi:DNA invertase Pin-like site-specific DNA recombinase